MKNRGEHALSIAMFMLSINCIDNVLEQINVLQNII